MMQTSPPKILIVEPAPESLETLVAVCARRFDAQITCVADAESCLDCDMLDPHDLVLTSFDLPDVDGLELAARLLALRSRPIILITDEPNYDTAIEAMRLGVKDVFCRPVDEDEMIDAAERALRGYQLRRDHAARYRRMRHLVRHVIRERRHLNRRVELVCQDLVGAHRRLAHRVVQLGDSHAGAD